MAQALRALALVTQAHRVPAKKLGDLKKLVSLYRGCNPRGKISPDIRGAWHEAKHPACLFAPTQTARDQ